MECSSDEAEERLSSTELLIPPEAPFPNSGTPDDAHNFPLLTKQNLRWLFDFNGEYLLASRIHKTFTFNFKVIIGIVIIVGVFPMAARNRLNVFNKTAH